MMTTPRRTTLIVEVDLDPMPGMCHTDEWWRYALQRMLDKSYGFYHPAVATIDDYAGAIIDTLVNPVDAAPATITTQHGTYIRPTVTP